MYFYALSDLKPGFFEPVTAEEYPGNDAGRFRPDLVEFGKTVVGLDFEGTGLR
jgi:hypothetical protein